MYQNTEYPELHEILDKKFNIVSRLELYDLDHDYSNLHNWFQKNKKDSFAADDRFLIMHFDTDYYINKNYGVILNNFFNLWNFYNYPLYTMIFCTNHYGIKNEIDSICKFSDKPMVIETFLNRMLFPISLPETKDIKIETIKQHAVCLSGGTGRSHRHALFSKLKHLHPEKIAYSIRKNI